MQFTVIPLEKRIKRCSLSCFLSSSTCTFPVSDPCIQYLCTDTNLIKTEKNLFASLKRWEKAEFWVFLFQGPGISSKTWKSENQGKRFECKIFAPHYLKRCNWCHKNIQVSLYSCFRRLVQLGQSTITIQR